MADMENIKKQNKELEALRSIYGNEWCCESATKGARTFQATIKESGHSTTLYVSLSADYPSSSPPEYEISAPSLRGNLKHALGILLEDIYLSHMGEAIIYQFIERIREFLRTCTPSSKNQTTLEKNSVIWKLDKGKQKKKQAIIEKNTGFGKSARTKWNKKQKFIDNSIPMFPTIIHGEFIQDRKSVFQGHVAIVTSDMEVRQVLEILKENRKIAAAKHNVFAYRFKCKRRGVIIQDCDDDREAHAGGRLLQLVTLLKPENAMVIVTRWFGGINLGSDRFRHYNNAARQALVAAGFIQKSKKK